MSVDACASLPAVPGVSARGCFVSSFSAVSAAVAHARFTPMHDAHNSCSDTAINSLRVQRATSYNPQGVVAHNSRRKVRLSSTVGSRSVELAECSGECPGPGPCAGGRSGRGVGVSGLAAACLEIPRSLVMTPGRHQFAPQSLGWARVCGTGKSGVWMLKL